MTENHDVRVQLCHAAGVAVDTRRDAVLASLDEERLLGLAQALIRLDTANPPGNEQAVAEFLAGYLGRLGLTTQLQMVRPGRPNVPATLGRPGARTAIVAEPTELLPVIAHTGDAYIEVVTRGVEAHASTPEAGVNAIEQMAGINPGVHGWAAFSDANILVGEAATPTVVFGPGSIARQAHRPDESVGIDELVAAAKIYALTILRVLG